MHEIVTNDWFLFATGICSILGLMASVLIVKKVIGINSKIDINKQTINGSNNNTAGRDVNVNNFYNFNYPIKHEISIGNILKNISEFTINLQFEKPDTGEYTIEEKINYNKLTQFKEFFDDYMENYNIVKEKIRIISAEDINFERRLVKYVKNKYIKLYDKNNPNLTLNNILEEIENDLKQNTNLSIDDISCTHYIVFYVFALCKIFEKPIKGL
ncbi:ABC-three component system protein [Campylobacter upsaliensis]|uniref:ABC-three component system protein n=2 Tax=Campylobacter upsaliensis TaxID=28080 RepID=UPI0022EA2245|nr:ABC-three component system protein [Campylobacter upsaliensis]